MLDLGASPPSNAYLTKLTLRRPEKYFPLRVYVCESCWLVQAEAYSRAAELFNEEYAYFSSFSSEWVKHADKLVESAVNKYGLSDKSHVIEIASNDGYLLQHVARRGIPCLGIEPTASTAAVARQKGLEVVQEFLTLDLAQQLAQRALLNQLLRLQKRAHDRVRRPGVPADHSLCRGEHASRPVNDRP
ncbi:MAG: hypothetical protein RIR54_374, partial [Actinomycetota bacterium]